MADHVGVPPPGWDAAEIAALGEAIGFDRGQSRYIGGWVRDALAGRAPGDLDIGTILLPDQIKSRVEAAGLTVWSSPSGLAHGTVGAIIGGRNVEITTLRRDVSTDGRRATVAFGGSWEEDAARRDFTINALSADPQSGTVFDYFGGREDLAAGSVRFIGDPFQRIAEDHLRILRFFRFHARFGVGAPEPAAYEACVARANDLMALSRERIADELLKLLGCEAPVVAIDWMLRRDVLKPVVPEIGAAGLQRLDALVRAERAAGIPADPVRRLAALLPGDAAEADGIAARLRLSNVMRKRLSLALGPLQASAQELAYRIGTEGALDRMLLNGAIDQARDMLGWQPPALPLSGGALVSRGIRAGPQVARALRMVEDRWVSERFPDRERTEQIADQVAALLLDQNSNAASGASGAA